MSELSAAKAMHAELRKKERAAEKKEPEHSAWRVKELVQHAAEHEALAKLQEKDPKTREILDLLEMDMDQPSLY